MNDPVQDSIKFNLKELIEQSQNCNSTQKKVWSHFGFLAKEKKTWILYLNLCSLSWIKPEICYPFQIPPKTKPNSN